MQFAASGIQSCLAATIPTVCEVFVVTCGACLNPSLKGMTHLFEEKKMSIIVLNSGGDDGWDEGGVDNIVQEATYET